MRHLDRLLDGRITVFTRQSQFKPSTNPKTASADFFPWIGGHREDNLNEVTAKSGCFDKIFPSQQESNSARSTIWANVRHKSGLHKLSSFLVSTLDHREAHATVSSKSTFKPPPRVTLTDTKREAWLKDLANAAIPLRRLSRTIPHGIRGRVLLEHCLAKRIPCWRAVWLSKCVGANEIRAFKRKGASGTLSAGGEAKWIRDWTGNVAAFVEALVEDCGSLDWSLRIEYAYAPRSLRVRMSLTFTLRLQLVSHIFAEQLLDSDHFLDWISTSLRGSDPDHLPIWLLITRMFWDHLLCYRHRGRQIVESLLTQLATVSR